MLVGCRLFRGGPSGLSRKFELKDNGKLKLANATRILTYFTKRWFGIRPNTVLFKTHPFLKALIPNELHLIELVL